MTRRAHPPGVSFFAFQDIITAVAGIFILITLVMVLDLIEKVDAASNTMVGDAAEIQRIIEQMEKESEQIEAELNQRSQQLGRVTQAIEAAGAMDVDQLRERVESRREIADDVSGQASAAQRQFDKANQRLEELKRRDAAEESAASTQSEALLEQTTLYQSQLEKISRSSSPLYNDTLADGRDLIIIRLGDHPSNTDRLSIRDGGSQLRLAFNNVQSMINNLRHADHRKRHYFIMISPGGASDFKILRDFLDNATPTARYGYDAVGSGDDVMLNFELEL